jgi:hypothetical protein
MSFVKLGLNQNGNYSHKDSSEDGMYILSFFLTDDVGPHITSFMEWGLTNKWENDETSGNCTLLQKENDHILLSDLYSEEDVPTKLKLSKEQYRQILTDWEEKVLKLKPKEVIIKYENGEFIIETKN